MQSNSVVSSKMWKDTMSTSEQRMQTANDNELDRYVYN